MDEEEIINEIENDCDILSYLNICPHEDELETFPEVLLFIKQLKKFICKQQSKWHKLRRKFREHLRIIPKILPTTNN